MAITISSNAATTRTNLGLGTAALTTVGTGNNAVVQLNADGKIPALNGAALSNMPGGGILQIRESSSTTPFTSTSTSYQTDLSETITLSSTSSKVLIWWCDGFQHQQAGVSSHNKITRTPSGGSEVEVGYSRNEWGQSNFSLFSMVFIDSPATTTALTYKRQYQVQSGLTIQSSMNNFKRQLILMEIKT